MWTEITELDGSYAGDNSRTAETELLVLELGYRVAFDLTASIWGICGDFG